jgi:hypothetical protein
MKALQNGIATCNSVRIVATGPKVAQRANQPLKAFLKQQNKILLTALGSYNPKSCLFAPSTRSRNEMNRIKAAENHNRPL